MFHLRPFLRLPRPCPSIRRPSLPHSLPSQSPPHLFRPARRRLRALPSATASSASRPFIKRSKIIILRTKISSLPPHERPERPRRRSGITFSGETSTVPILGIILRAKIRLGRARRFFPPHHRRAENYLTHLILTPPANAPRRAGRGREFSGGVSVQSGDAAPVEAPAAIQALHGGREITRIAARGRCARHPNGIRRGARRLAGLSPGPKSYIIRRPRPYPPSSRAMSTARKSAANVLGQRALPRRGHCP